MCFLRAARLFLVVGLWCRVYHFPEGPWLLQKWLLYMYSAPSLSKSVRDWQCMRYHVVLPAVPKRSRRTWVLAPAVTLASLGLV